MSVRLRQWSNAKKDLSGSPERSFSAFSSRNAAG
jgi:hypothetical protein